MNPLIKKGFCRFQIDLFDEKNKQNVEFSGFFFSHLICQLLILDSHLYDATVLLSLSFCHNFFSVAVIDNWRINSKYYKNKRTSWKRWVMIPTTAFCKHHQRIFRWPREFLKIVILLSQNYSKHSYKQVELLYTNAENHAIALESFLRKDVK